MSSPDTITEQIAIEPRKGRAIAIARLMVALAITFGVLIYAWGRTLLEGVMINGRPKPLYVVMLVAGVAAVMSTTSGLSQRLRSPRLDRIVLRGVAACWIVGISIAMWFVVGRLLPKFIVVPLFMLASLWVVCLAWMLYRPWPWNQRIVVLALCVLFQVGFVALFRVEGI